MALARNKYKGFFERLRINQRKTNPGQAIQRKADRARTQITEYHRQYQGVEILIIIALAENFFSILKTECIHRVKLSGYDGARLIISEYINFYNNCRIQTKTKLTPLEKRNQFVA